MNTILLLTASLVFPCLLLFLAMLYGLRKHVPPVRYRVIFLFVGLGIGTIILGGLWCVFAHYNLLGRISIGMYFAFVTASIPEEGFRYLVIRLGFWKGKGITPIIALLLGAIVGLMFATFEHAEYALSKGWDVWIARSFTSVPYHVLSGAVLGYFALKSIQTKKPWGLAAMLFLILIHGLADWPMIDPDSKQDVDQIGFIASGWAGNIASLVVVAILVGYCVIQARKQAKSDNTQQTNRLP